MAKHQTLSDLLADLFSVDEFRDWIRRLRGRLRAWMAAPDSPELRVKIQRSLAGSMGVLLG